MLLALFFLASGGPYPGRASAARLTAVASTPFGVRNTTGAIPRPDGALIGSLLVVVLFVGGYRVYTN